METMKVEFVRRKAKIFQRKKDIQFSRKEFAVQKTFSSKSVERDIRRTEHCQGISLEGGLWGPKEEGVL